MFNRWTPIIRMLKREGVGIVTKDKNRVTFHDASNRS